MNERIRQILLQVVPMAGEDGEYLPSLHTPEDIERFAELIIKECLEVIDRRNGWVNDENRDSQFVHGYERAVRHCSMFIKEYLGVKE